METINKISSVFLVDDDKLFLLSLKHNLMKKFKDVHFRIFSTGEDCINHLNESPDIVILDYYLKNDESPPHAVNGIQVLKEIKSNHPDTEVIILSAQDKLEVAVNAIKCGAYEYVVKSESAFVRLFNIVRRARVNIAVAQLDTKYTRWNYMMAAFLLSFLISITVYYLSR
jgi:two-component system OmpR family response regulator